MNVKKYWRKWFRVIHRDLGFFFFGMTIIYGLSGIAINHLNDWNPNYIVKTYEFQIAENLEKFDVSKETVLNILKDRNLEHLYKKHYFPSPETMKIFLKGGSIEVDLESGYAFQEMVKRRPIFHYVNYLHYNPIRWWTYFSDMFAVSLIIFAITGVFLIKGKKGIWGRGGIYMLIGINIPIIFLIVLK